MPHTRGVRTIGLRSLGGSPGPSLSVRGGGGSAPVDDWLLHGGLWADSGVWDDTNVWED